MISNVIRSLVLSFVHRFQVFHSLLRRCPPPTFQKLTAWFYQAAQSRSPNPATLTTRNYAIKKTSIPRQSFVNYNSLRLIANAIIHLRSLRLAMGSDVGIPRPSGTLSGGRGEKIVAIVRHGLSWVETFYHQSRNWNWNDCGVKQAGGHENDCTTS